MVSVQTSGASYVAQREYLWERNAAFESAFILSRKVQFNAVNKWEKQTGKEQQQQQTFQSRIDSIENKIAKSIFTMSKQKCRTVKSNKGGFSFICIWLFYLCSPRTMELNFRWSKLTLFSAFFSSFFFLYHFFFMFNSTWMIKQLTLLFWK